MNEGKKTPFDIGSVLVVDDEPEVLATLRRQLRREFTVYTAESAEQALEILNTHPVQTIISDQRMPEMTGAEFLARAKAEYPDTVRILLTGYADLQAMIEAINSGQIFRYITKPWDPMEIRTLVREACQRCHLVQENQRLVTALQDANAELEQRVEARTRELAESERRYRTIVEGTSDPVMLVDAAGQITAVNPAFTRVTGYVSEEVVGHSPHILSSGRHTQEFYDGMRCSLRDTGSWRGPIWNRRKDGSIYVQRLTVSCACAPDGELNYYISVYTDLEVDAEQLDRIWVDAQHDPLTGMPNRTLLMDRLQTALLEAERDGSLLAVLFLDLDGFKPINDTHGHAVGDEVLQTVAMRLLDLVRRTDTVARIGGDEFVVVLRDLKQRESAQEIDTHLASTISEPVATSKGPVSVGASVGLAFYPEDGTDAVELLKRADNAMYKEKRLRKQG